MAECRAEDIILAMLLGKKMKPAPVVPVTWYF